MKLKPGFFLLIIVSLWYKTVLKTRKVLSEYWLDEQMNISELSKIIYVEGLVHTKWSFIIWVASTPLRVDLEFAKLHMSLTEIN